MTEASTDPRTYFKFQSCGRCFYKPCDRLRYGGVFSGKFFLIHNSYLGMGFFDCPFNSDSFDEILQLFQDFSIGELDSAISDIYTAFTPSEQMQYRMEHYVSNYSDFGGRMEFLKALWDDQVISVLRIPLFFTTDVKMRKWLYALETLNYIHKKTILEDNLTRTAVTDSMVAQNDSAPASSESASTNKPAPDNARDKTEKPEEELLTEIEVFVEGEEGPRKVLSGGTLEIVPDLLVGKKITCREVNGVSVTWNMTGYHTEEKSGSEVSFQIRGWPKFAHIVWFPNEKPHTAIITAKDKKGNRKSANLNVFSGSKELLEFNFIKLPVWKKWNEIKDKIEDLIDEATGRKIEITLLEGGVAYSANFKESTKEKVFFSYDLAGGFNPFMEAELIVALGPVPGPKIIQKYFKFIKFELFVSGGMGLNFHFSKSDIDKHKTELVCEPKFEFGINGTSHIETQLLTKKIVIIDAKLGALSGLEGSFGGFTEGEGLGVKGELSWSGLKAQGYIEAMDGRYKYSREITFIDSVTLLKGEKVYFVNSRSEQKSLE